MSNTNQIIPECFGDTLLIEMIGYKKPNHQYGIGTVLELMEVELKKQKIVGIIDNDKKKEHKYYHEFQVRKEENSLILKKHPDRNHHLILVCPAFDMFVWNSALDVNVDLKRAKFRDFETFKKAAKRQNVGSNQAVKQFLNTIKQKKAPGFVTLKTWLEDIIGEPF